MDLDLGGCCEQLMMAEKARLFRDSATLRKILAVDNPRATDRSAWRGKNWLGEALMRVRVELQA
jgi:predicted NAD-dependent protein-ADP-ribosyltransferase YbiA (DUF1768 family)